MDDTREETLPHGVSWDVFVVEFVPPGQTEWRAFSHGEHDTLEQAEGWIEAQGFDSGHAISQHPTDRFVNRWVTK